MIKKTKPKQNKTKTLSSNYVSISYKPFLGIEHCVLFLLGFIQTEIHLFLILIFVLHCTTCTNSDCGIHIANSQKLARNQHLLVYVRLFVCLFVFLKSYRRHRTSADIVRV